MNNTKLNLKDLSVTSFVTNIDQKNKGKVLGGEFTDPQQCGVTFTARPTMCTNAMYWCIEDNCNG